MCSMFTTMKKLPKSDSNEIRPEDAEIGAKLAAARQAAGLTQLELAVRTGWLKDDEETPNQQRVSHYEAGRRRITLIDFLAYAEAVGSTPEGILGIKKQPVKRK